MILQRPKAGNVGSNSPKWTGITPKRRELRFLAVILVAELAVWLAGTVRASVQEGTPPAPAEDAPVSQQIAALRKQVTDLQNQVRDLIVELAKANQRISQLERQIGTTGMTQPPQTGENAPGDTLVIPDDQPLASPEAAFQTVQERYLKEFADLPLESDRDRANYVRRARQWVARLNRELTDQIEWTCEVQKVEMLRTGAAYVDVRIIDPQTGQPRSEVHVLEIPRRVALTIKRIRESPDKPIPYKLSGIFRLQLEVNEDRIEEGVFREPRFVGPFVDFGYEIDVRSLSPIENEPGSGTGSGGGGG